MAERNEPDRPSWAALVRHLRDIGVTDERVLAAFAAVDRAAFVPEALRDVADEDRPLPIGGGQTISQPQVVAVMVEALELGPGDRVLDVGTGSGYAAAILAELAGEVFTIERLADLAAEARRRLAAEPRPAAVHVRVGDGTLGWPEAAPFDAVLVSAAGPAVAPPLVAQLAPGGRLVMPVGPGPDEQRLVRVRRSADGQRVAEEPLGWVRFVPLLGAAGWAEPEA
ncbi:MAG: protein-L-isoaspartate(D-aspartate) O-methyltransferase [Acidimicrobiales bacterium]